VLGVALGFEGIPQQYKSGTAAIADERFSYTGYTLNTIVASSLRRAIALVERHGGRLEGDSVRVRTQAFQPTALETWDDYGSPAERVPVNDARWTFSGHWERQRPAPRSGMESLRWTRAGGAEASITFEGTGAILAGTYLPSGGTADVYLDGKLHRTVDVYSDEETSRSEEAVWHAFRLQPGTHRLRVVARGEPYRAPSGQASSGADVSLSYLLVFR
jgi:hypothetical protein